ncbi:MAG: endonuclease MutS2 [Acidobacteria bacterium]|nr:MAG: endonuclease MutS2 [Acidobacteriota bacterium]REK02482.1 MAG: endonuclease MutS2 [Acidobacteriota bacterium]REK13716.1 MAG: endonuclease MutS2 [Acidobacteriota bacterium]REK41710.1 MAG: endonuclease MutS2 [Acidobacteriota bacterium]
MFSIETLQFEKLLDLVSGNAQTPMGRKRVLSLEPRSNRLDLDRDLNLLQEAISLRNEDVRWRFSGIKDPAEPMKRLRIKDTLLEPLELRDLASIMRQAVEVRSLIGEHQADAPELWSIVLQINPELSSVASDITRKILPDGQLDDSASSELQRIRREIASQRANLTRTLEGIMRSRGDAVQDDIVTVRNDRFVIPVKSDFKGKVSGVAHGASSSGATVFIEPLEAIEANNELQTLRAKEEQEILRILFEIADGLRERYTLIELAIEAVTELDVLNAKSEFAKGFSAVVPKISDDGVLNLEEARHPLLEDGLRRSNGEIVPVSLRLSSEHPVMIISGANAGGKTVVLKTAGLLSMMGVSGLPVPAESASVPFYASIAADIGDRQSIAANLSTFSSHISNIAEMIDDAEMPALVLLDEVGTGTDPEEGSALGVAIVDHFRNKGSHVIASTHYKGLKIYAANDEAVINASVEFNEKTLEPTYRLLTGIAGASSGLEMANRFGIGDEIVAKARENLKDASREAESYLHKLQAETKQAEDLRVALEEEREAVAERYAGLDVEFHQKERLRRAEFEKKVLELVRDFEKNSKEILKSIEDRKERKKAEKELAAKKSALKKKAAAATGRTEESPKPSAEVKEVEKPIEEGSEVLLKRFGTVGKVEKIDGEEAEVMVGSMRMRQELADLQRVASCSPKKAKRDAGAGKAVDEAASKDIARELNLIGKTTLDAEVDVDRFLDESYMGRLDSVRIIHGFGTGALKNAVHQILKGHPHVESFGFAPQNEGGNGATIVVLKK